MKKILFLFFIISIWALEGAEVVQTVHVGDGPSRSIILPDGSKAYIVNRDSDEVTVLNLLVFPHTILAHIPVGDAPSHILIHPNGNKIFVINRKSGSISIINPIIDTVINTIQSVKASPTLGAISPDGHYI